MSQPKQMNDHKDVIIDVDALEKAQKNAKNEQSTKRLNETQSIQTKKGRSRTFWIILKITLLVIAFIVYADYYFDEIQRTLKCNLGRMTDERVAALRSKAEQYHKIFGYTLQIPLYGRGNNGAIFQIWHWDTQRLMALKVEKYDDYQSSSPREIPLRKDFQTAANQMSPSLVPKVYKVWIGDGHIFTMTEPINGQDCQNRSKVKGMQKEEIVDLLVDGIRFFREYNGQKNAHFDIKPANIMIRDGDGKAKFIDFGNADTETGFNGNPRQNSTRLYGSGMTFYAKTHKEIIKHLSYPWAVHDFIAFLNTILDIVNFQYDLGFYHCNWPWLANFQAQRENKEVFWAKMKKDRGCQSVPKEIINLLDLMMSKLPNGYWCGHDGNFSCYFGVEWPSEYEVSWMRSEKTDKSALIQETEKRARWNIAELQQINHDMWRRMSAENPPSNEDLKAVERRHDFWIKIIVFNFFLLAMYLAYLRRQQMAM